ncbi:related to ATP-dependent RNA helicase chl1 [Lecanosticta acicola]|uniref:Related to ATP-dependent RNA helicase chl1 n=1 Tax=Lecanosticta acicola TaxID=111012 RepID=A0AAI8Z3I6_9PEZI|nr:related to ATP-dependent RNA helicase chl1 [Lecanosticta acicola]
MLRLTVTLAAKVAIDEYLRLRREQSGSFTPSTPEKDDRLSHAAVGSPIDHHDLIDVSKFLVQNGKTDDAAKEWRLDTLLKGAAVYQPPPPPRPEPTPEYKALMQRLREEEERRQYERMINPPPKPEAFSQRFPGAGSTFGSGIDLGHNTADQVDEVTYADVNRQMILIINVLVSIICTSVAVWMAARRWSVPERLGLSFSSSTVVAVAEVAIYLGYIRRIKDAKVTERKSIETKEIVDTWVIDGKSTSQHSQLQDSLRFRKGKHR